MKLRLLALCLLLCALLSVTALAADSEDLLNDYADILTEQEEATVLARLQEVSQGVDVAVATFDKGIQGDMWALAQNYCGTMGIEDGIVLIWRRGVDYNEYYFLPVGKGEKIFDDSVLDRLEGKCVDELRTKDFASAFGVYANVCELAINDRNRVNLMPIVLSILIGAALSFLIPMASLKGELKSVRSKPAAQSYVRENSFRLTTQRDIFLYRNVVRTAKQSSSSGGRSGGGGRSGRGGRC